MVALVQWDGAVFQAIAFALHEAARLGEEVEGPVRLRIAGGDQERPIRSLDEPDHRPPRSAGMAPQGLDEQDLAPAQEIGFQRAFGRAVTAVASDAAYRENALSNRLMMSWRSSRRRC